MQMRPILPLQVLSSSTSVPSLHTWTYDFVELCKFLFFVFAAGVHVPCPIRLQFNRGQAGTGPRERREEAEE